MTSPNDDNSNEDEGTSSEEEDSVQIYQLEISLRDSKPKIWRRIHVPSNFRFECLHEAIQDCMGWDGMHGHRFEMKKQYSLGLTHEMPEMIGPSVDGGLLEIRDERKVKINEYLNATGDNGWYLYDYGDRWYHDIILEKILSPVEGERYPKCLGGEKACPPNDCGGIYEYKKILEIVKDPNHPEYEEKKEWVDDDFDPDAFDPTTVFAED